MKLIVTDHGSACCHRLNTLASTSALSYRAATPRLSAKVALMNGSD
ncbi:MAG: hypothetical protein HIU92_12535 [Proteobacteria bacterium]|nr:hypothetical protein [Pseudomonadota bacterium]